MQWAYVTRYDVSRTTPRTAMAVEFSQKYNHQMVIAESKMRRFLARKRCSRLHTNSFSECPHTLARCMSIFGSYRPTETILALVFEGWIDTRHSMFLTSIRLSPAGCFRQKTGPTEEQPLVSSLRRTIIRLGK
jgi:hypothetical protein